MGYTAKEIFGIVRSVSLLHAFCNGIAMILMYMADGKDAIWCTFEHKPETFNLSGFTLPLVIYSFASSFRALQYASEYLKTSNAKALRKCQLAAVLSLFLALWMLFGLYYDVGVLNGRYAQLTSSPSSYCVMSTPIAVYLIAVGWIALLFSQSALYFLANVLIRNSHPNAADISLFALGLSATRKIVSFVKRGRKGVLNTVGFAKKFVQRSIRVKTQHDDVFREVNYSSGMMRYCTLQELKESISDRLDVPRNDILSLLKNGNVAIENDEDVARLTNSDYIDVVFGNARPFEHVMPDLMPAYVPVVPRPYEPVPAFAPFTASLSQIV